MTWDGIAKILDVEGTLQARGEEAAEGCDQGGENGDHHSVEVDRLETEVIHVQDVHEEARQLVHLVNEDRIRIAVDLVETGGVYAVVNGTDEVVDVGEDVGEGDGREHGAGPGADKALDGFLGRDGD